MSTNKRYTQWGQYGSVHRPSGDTVKKLEPGVYAIDVDMHGLYFVQIKNSTEKLLNLPDSKSSEVLSEIKKFWGLEDKYRMFGFTYKRGVLLTGIAGGGKTSTLRLASADIVERGGLVILFDYPPYFKAGMRLLREVEDDRKVVVIMEDIDTLVYRYDESQIINMLDGVETSDNTVWVATSNYPERLSRRIINRPSRFDKVIEIGALSAASRQVYIEHLLSKADDDIRSKVDVDKFVAATKGMTMAHIKELFISNVILGHDFNRSVNRLVEMDKEITKMRVDAFDRQKNGGEEPCIYNSVDMQDQLFKGDPRKIT